MAAPVAMPPPLLGAIKIARPRAGRVIERLSVIYELLVGGREILLLALVLPGQVTKLPDIGKPVATSNLPSPLLEGKAVPGRVNLIWGLALPASWKGR